MKLKTKFLKFSAGRPVAMLHKNLASRASIHVDDRIFIEKSGRKIAAVVDTATGILKENEVALSTEITSQLKLKENAVVKINPAPRPESLSLIMKKISCQKLSEKELEKIMSDIVSNNLTESEIAYFVSAVNSCGMSVEEIISMIKAIVKTGSKLNLKGRIADKHSSGGIPGRTTPIIVSICAAAGLTMPKTSSRAITAASGTADALEVICKVDFSASEIKKILAKTNACMVWGGSLNLAPADDKIIQVERLLNLDPEPQLLASIMAKKIAVNAKYVLIDIPYGKHAKFRRKKAEVLAEKFSRIAEYFHIKLACSLKKINSPLGNGIGPALEIKDAIKVLRRESSCYLLEKRSLELSGKLLELAGKAEKGKGIKLAEIILNSGKAYEKFLEIIKAQKGKLAKIREAKLKYSIAANKSGRIKEMNIKKLNELARILGCPADKFAGIYLYKHYGERAEKGEKILDLFAESPAELKEGIKFYKNTSPITFGEF